MSQQDDLGRGRYMPYQTLARTDFPTNSIDIDANFNNLMGHLPPLGKRGPWLAGGSIRKFMHNIQNKADYDIFFASQVQCDEYCDMLRSVGAEELGRNIFNTSFKLANKYLIQCIHHEFRNTLIQTMDRFDITICQFGFDGTHFIWSDQASEDVGKQEFHFLGTSDPIYNLNRGYKYASEGYRPADGEVAKVLRRVARTPTSLKNNRKISGNGWKGEVTVTHGTMPKGFHTDSIGPSRSEPSSNI